MDHLRDWSKVFSLGRCSLHGHFIVCQKKIECFFNNSIIDNDRTDLPIDRQTVVMFIHMVICQLIGSMNMTGKCV